MGYADVVLADRPYHYWRGTASSGTERDLTGANPGTYSGGFTTDHVPLVIGDPNSSSVLYNGSTGTMDAGTLSVNPTTIEFWIRPMADLVAGGSPLVPISNDTTRTNYIAFGSVTTQTNPLARC